MLNTETQVFSSANLSWLTAQAGASFRPLWEKVDDHTNVLDMGSLAAADICMRTIEVSSVVNITQNITLTGQYSVRRGGMFVVAAGVTVTCANAYFDANQYQQIFSIAASGAVITGTLKNSKHSVCWFGVDSTGATNSGALINTVFTIRITPQHWFPYGSYNANGVPLIPPAVAGADPYQLVGDEGSTLLTNINNNVDAGSNTAMVDGQNVGLFNNFRLNGPGQKGAALGLAGCLMDGFAIGGVIAGGSGVKTNVKNVYFANLHFGMLWNTTDGHINIDTVTFSGNYCSVGVLSTGSDYHITNASSASEQLACIYLPANTIGLGVNFTIKIAAGGTGWYFRTMPWFIVHDTVNDSRLPNTAAINLIDVGSVFEGVNGEIIGNGFLCSGSTTTHFKGVKFINGGPNNYPGSAYTITPSMTACAPFNRTDYCVIAGSISMDMTDSGSQSMFIPGTVGVFCQTDPYSMVVNRNAAYKPSELVAGTSWFGTSNPAYSFFVDYQPLLTQLTFAAGSKTATYTMSDHEIASPQYIFPQLVFTSSQPQLWSYSISGSVITFTLATAPTATLYAKAWIMSPGV